MNDNVIQNGYNLILINQEFNSIISQGYKLVATGKDNDLLDFGYLRGIWYFAIP